MHAKKLGWSFTVCRDPQERRKTKSNPPPYLTGEGFTLVDRRTSDDRREIECETKFYNQEEFSFACSD